MITYELAKQLKDLGFPQDKTQFIVRKYSLAAEPIVWQRPPEGIELGTLSGELEWELALPSLSELIDACGDKIKGIEWLDGDGIYAYQEMGHIDKPYGSSLDSVDEAVANLYIKLNERIEK